MKINLPGNKSKKQSDEQPPWDEPESLGSLEELASEKHLNKKLQKAKDNSATERYCEMLHTQINSLAEKVLNLSERRTVIVYHPESNSAFLGSREEADEHCIIYEDANDFMEHVQRDTTEVSDPQKHINKLRKGINEAQNTLFQLQVYAKDNIDK